MAEAVNPEKIVESVSVGNLKTIADASAHSMALAMQNAVAHQQAMQQIQLSVVGNITKRLTEVDPAEARSIGKVLTGNDLAEQLAQLSSAIASIQQQMKGAQTTPPPTA